MGHKDALIAVASGARMGEVYFAVYSQSQSRLVLCVEEQVCPPETAIEQLNALKEDNSAAVIAAGTGWSAYEELDNWKSEVCSEVVFDVTLPNAQYMLKLAIDAYSKGEVSNAVN